MACHRYLTKSVSVRPFAAIEDATINSRPFRLDAGKCHPPLALRAKALLQRHWLGDSTRVWSSDICTSLSTGGSAIASLSQPTPSVFSYWPVMD